jgi:hypothetical protein
MLGMLIHGAMHGNIKCITAVVDLAKAQPATATPSTAYGAGYISTNSSPFCCSRRQEIPTGK